MLRKRPKLLSSGASLDGNRDILNISKARGLLSECGVANEVWSVFVSQPPLVVCHVIVPIMSYVFLSLSAPHCWPFHGPFCMAAGGAALPDVPICREPKWALFNFSVPQLMSGF